MTKEPDLYELLYVSCIAPSTRISVVAHIAQAARRKNASTGITGLLVFDGERFAQHLEGHAQAVRKLFDSVERDPRHTQVQVLHQGESNQRKFHRFSMAYANVGELESLRSLEMKNGAGAFDAFMQLVPAIDMEP